MKEKTMYEQEYIQIETKLNKMKSEGKDEYDVRKMGEVLAESKMMIPDCLKRLATAYEDLKNKLQVCNSSHKQTYNLKFRFYFIKKLI